VTSSYHQRWGQAVYNAVAELYRIRQGYDVKIVGDYSFDIAPEVPVYARDDRFAVMQIGEILELPADVVKSLPSFRE
jgi:hypothetical protein